MNLFDPNIKKYVIKWQAAGNDGNLLDEGVIENEDGKVLGLVREQENGIRVFEPDDSLIIRMSLNFLSLSKNYDIDEFTSGSKFIGKAKSKSKFFSIQTQKKMWVENPKKDVILKGVYPYTGEHNKFVDSNGKTIATVSADKLKTVLDIQDLNFDRKILFSFYVYVVMRGPSAFGQ